MIRHNSRQAYEMGSMARGVSAHAPLGVATAFAVPQAQAPSPALVETMSRLEEQTERMPSREEPEVITRFRAVLSTRSFSTNAISKETARLYGACSPYFIPHDFCYRRIAPSMCQLVAMSRITRYSLVDLLSFFGFVPDEISRLQVKLHADRTVLLPSVLYDKNRRFPFLGSSLASKDFDTTVPFATRVAREPFTSARGVENHNRQSFLYAKIGERDVFAFPELVPGSIVRVDPRRTTIEASSNRPTQEWPIYLVEYSGGLTCARVSKGQGNRIFLIPHALPFGCREFYLDHDAVILGTVDAELHPLRGVHLPNITTSERPIATLRTQDFAHGDVSLGKLLRRHRERSGMSFRRASEVSVRIADELGSAEYEISPALLCQCETSESIPRNIAKIFSLCILYSIDLWTLLESAGISLQETGHEPLPLHLSPRATKSLEIVKDFHQKTPSTLAAYLAELFDEVPLFLANAWPHLLPGRPATSGELFWFGQSDEVFHPLLKGTRLIAVDAQRKNGVHDEMPTEPWQRPLMLLLTRQGKYVCGFCSVNRETIIVEPHADCPLPPVRFRNGVDADLIGQVVAVVRLFPNHSRDL